jgi:hypothetical protein
LPNAYIQGILLDAAGGVGFAPASVFGEIIGGGNEIRLVSGSQVYSSPSGGTVPTPLPSSALAGGALLGVCGLLRKLRFRGRRSL